MQSIPRECIDSILHVHERTFRTMPGKLLLGPTGSRISADYLDPCPGFSGRLDVIHKTNLPLLFTIEPENERLRARKHTESDWYPSHLHLTAVYGPVRLEEDKFITWDDLLISVQSWTNHAQQDVCLRLVLPDTATKTGEAYEYRVRQLPHGLEAGFLIRDENAFSGNGMLRIPAGGVVQLTVAAAFWNMKEEKPEAASEKLRTYFQTTPDSLLERQQASYDAWFSDVPVFRSDDPVLDKTWWYRWFLLRHNYLEPRTGRLQHGFFTEGRSHKGVKTPFAFQGHEFTQLIPLSTPMHLLDVRWKGDGKPAAETVRSLVDSMDEAGYFSVTTVDGHGTHYGNFAQWALYRFLCVHPDPELLREVLPAFKESFRAVVKGQATEQDILPVCYDHRRTGKEYQPSFWYFTGYPDRAQDNTTFTPLKRVDLACCLYVNADALARMCVQCADPDAGEFARTADTLKQLILEKMWDEEDGYFYDLHYLTEEKARIRNITGVDPFVAGITDERHLSALDVLLSSDELRTGDGFASVSRTSPVYAPQGGWKGHYFKGRNGCVWDGPSWPFTTALALDGLAKKSKLHAHRWDADFADLFRQYTLEHFQGHDTDRPYLVEHYDCETGEALSDEPDYLHSYYIDLVMRHVAGLEVTESGIRVDPVDIGLEWFTLSQVQVCGHRVDMEYCRGTGYRIRVDGVERFQGMDPSGTVIAWNRDT